MQTQKPSVENSVLAHRILTYVLGFQHKETVMKRFLSLSVVALGVSALAFYSSASAGPKIIGSGNASAKGGNGGSAVGPFSKGGNGGAAQAFGGNVKAKGFFSQVVNSGN